MAFRSVTHSGAIMILLTVCCPISPVIFAYRAVYELLNVGGWQAESFHFEHIGDNRYQIKSRFGYMEPDGERFFRTVSEKSDKTVWILSKGADTGNYYLTHGTSGGIIVLDSRTAYTTDSSFRKAPLKLNLNPRR